MASVYTYSRNIGFKYKLGRRQIPLSFIAGWSNHSPKAKKKQLQPRVVPPFSIQAHCHSNVVVSPFDSKKSNLLKPYPVGNTVFRRHYQRGDFPIAMEFDQTGRKVAWKVNLNELDYNYYLPLFFAGLCEVEYPYQFFVQEGLRDLLVNGKKKVLPVIPQLILPIKNALNTRNRTVIATTLKTLQVMVSNNETIGEALVPYYRQILPPLNLYKSHNGADIDYGQQKRENIGELVQETLEMLEIYGGRDAFINIKYMVPTYESYVRN